MKELIRNTTTMPTVRMMHLSSEHRELMPLAFGEFFNSSSLRGELASDRSLITS